MKTSTIEVDELVSTLSGAGVERQLRALPGVNHADVNYVAGSATVHYDESLITLEAIRERVVDCGYHCRGELVPGHVCAPADHKAARRCARRPCRSRRSRLARWARRFVNRPQDGRKGRSEGVVLEMLASETIRFQDGGCTVVYVARAGKLIGLIAIADAVQQTSMATIAKLQERGVKVAMITGDNQATAERIGKELGIDIVLADVLPGQKAAKIKELQAQGHKVGMVGDGINDAPALTQADVGFAIGAGTDVAMESAQAILMKSDPYDVVGAIELSRATLRKMHQNLWWAVGYNVIAFPL